MGVYYVFQTVQMVSNCAKHNFLSSSFRGTVLTGRKNLVWDAPLSRVILHVYMPKSIPQQNIKYCIKFTVFPFLIPFQLSQYIKLNETLSETG